MKLEKLMIIGFTFFCVCWLSGCTNHDSCQNVNELRFSLDSISDLTISYDEEDLNFFIAKDDKLLIREYMTTDKHRYYANVKQDDGSIHISEGGKPVFKDNFLRYIEIYLPASYHNDLTITTTNGSINLANVNLDISSLRIDSTSGNVQISKAAAGDIHLSSTSGPINLGEIKAETIKLETTSGNITCEKIDGLVTYTSTSGNAEFKSAVGSGSYQAKNSGDLVIEYTEVKGDLTFFNKNDTINLALPSGLEFEFEAQTKNGSINTSFQESTEMSGDKTIGIVGNNPAVSVKVETRNGNIEVTQ